MIQLVIILFSVNVFAAPMPTKPTDILLYKKVKELISAEGDIPIVKLSDLSSKKIAVLRGFVFDEKEEMRLRWRALMALARTEKAKAKKDITQAFKSKTWYLRNGAMIASEYAGKKWSEKWARYLFSDDKALLVRMSALDVLAKNKSRSNAKLMWTQLDSPNNFHKGQSLMLRGKILKILAGWSYPQDKKRFKKYLSDKDKVVKEAAIQAIKRL